MIKINWLNLFCGFRLICYNKCRAWFTPSSQEHETLYLNYHRTMNIGKWMSVVVKVKSGMKYSTTDGINKLIRNASLKIPTKTKFLPHCQSIDWVRESSSNVRILNSNVKIVAKHHKPDILSNYLWAKNFFGVQTQVTIIRPFDLKFRNCFFLYLVCDSLEVDGFVRKRMHR